MFESKIKKIPGKLPPISSRDKESCIEDLSKISKAKLLELIDRQKKIVTNKSFLNKLPDKGEKITTNYEKLLEELKTREEAEANLCDMMSSLSVHKKEMEDIEWSGNCNPGFSKSQSARCPDDESDSDETDPFKILTTHSGAGFAKKEIKVEKAEESLIKESDLIIDESSETKSSNNEDNKHQTLKNLEEYAVNLCSKFDSTKKVEKFYPHKTVVKVHKSKESLNQKKDTRWEVTAATPPPPVHDNVKMVSLKESLDIQQKQAKQLKEIQIKRATERLSKMVGLFPDSENASNYLDYRDRKESSSDESSNEEEKECYDEEEYDKDVAVAYNVVG